MRNNGLFRDFLRVFIYAFGIVLGVLCAYCLVVFIVYHLVDAFG